MIKVYYMESCPDCAHIGKQICGDARFEIVDIGAHVRHLKAFLRLRDREPVFEAVRRRGGVGIPCFVREDGTLTLTPEEVGLSSRPVSQGASCALDGSGC